ncbi:MAG: hypothetical protein KDA37_07240, partial [Planctomycetales bacterium]|nr:hypothetical protein [Planctomycetales bacterium]
VRIENAIPRQSRGLRWRSEAFLFSHCASCADNTAAPRRWCGKLAGFHQVPARQFADQSNYAPHEASGSRPAWSVKPSEL